MSANRHDCVASRDIRGCDDRNIHVIEPWVVALGNLLVQEGRFSGLGLHFEMASFIFEWARGGRLHIGKPYQATAEPLAMLPFVLLWGVIAWSLRYNMPFPIKDRQIGVPVQLISGLRLLAFT